MNTRFPFPDIIIENMKAGQPRDVFKNIGKELADNFLSNSDDIVQLMIDSEATGNSPIGDGVAVLGVRVPATMAPARICVFVKLDKPMAFKGTETQPCDMIFMVISPENEVQAHIRDLSAVIRTLRDRDLLASLRAQSLPDRIMNLFYARDTDMYKAA
jgi:PTS system nitrogen regulatory IIA component